MALPRIRPSATTSHHNRLLAATPAALLLLAAEVAAQSWVQLLPAHAPSMQLRLSMAYDEARTRTVLFSGDGSGETWLWDGTDWTQRNVPGPSPRSGTAMAYDAQRGRIVLFGGETGFGPTYLGDTWEWDGTNWTNRGVGGPSPRSGHAMVYDRLRQRVLLFGGGQPTGAETWEWNGASWSQLAPQSSPSPRRVHAMAYDSDLDRALLFGGDTGGAVALNDTWEWNGATADWTLLAQSSGPSAPLPQPRMNHAMAYDPANRRTVMFGGYSGMTGTPCCSLLSDTREWVGYAWALLQSGPSARIGHAMAMGPQGRIVLFGGGGLGDTWDFGGPPRAAVQAYESGCGAPRLTAATTTRPVLGTTMTVNVSNVPAGQPAFWAIGWNRMDPPWQLVGAPSCFVYVDPFAWNVATTPTGPATARFTLAIPNAPMWVGTRFHMQAWALAPGANVLGLIVSNVLSAVIGAT